MIDDLSLGTKDQVPLEKWDLEYVVKPSTNLPNEVLNHRAFLKDMLESFLLDLTTQAYVVA